MVSNISNIEQSFFQPLQTQRQSYTVDTPASSTSFDIEDKAIISSEAKLQNELEKFNAGQGDALDLALTEVMAKTTVSAEVNVIQAKKDMLDEILNMGT